MQKKTRVLELFHPLIQMWFSEKYGLPTDAQKKSWPVIASGKNVLITAPTGSGKTLAAFLWALNRLITGAWPAGALRVLYVSPLKALNSDIKQNLLIPLNELKHTFYKEGAEFPDINVVTRSGDTPGSERQRMIRRPPEILITTPESLNLLLSSRKARHILNGICTVVLDEIHAVVSGKRGSHLITAVDRLVLLAGDFQRVALSATIRPVERIAEFVGGYRIRVRDGEYFYQKREVSIIQSDDPKRFQVSVRLPDDASENAEEGSRWPLLVREFSSIIMKNRSTLFFVNTRRLAEKITRLINEEGTKQLAYSHHGSLSKEIRAAVERKLREGMLAAIVATSSLELGIDIGALDEVILIQTPPSVSSGIQRIGRAGHAVGQTSRGIIYPTHGMDFLEAAVMAESIMNRDIENAKPVVCPLDVLAQVIISMTGVMPRKTDELYGFLKSSYPFHTLSRLQFDLVLQMLTGRYADTRIRELRPRVYLDRIDNTVQGKEGVLLLIYHSGGTIPDRGYFGMRLQSSKEKIGELDEEFVWERSVGDAFSLGAQSWKITNIDYQNVEVIPWNGPVKLAPFWKAEKGRRDYHFFKKIGDFLERWNDELESQEFNTELQHRYCLNERGARELVRFLYRQKEATGAVLPHRHHVLIEHLSITVSKADIRQVVIHTMWGGRVNKPYALALSAAWEEIYGCHVEIVADNSAVLVLLPHDFDFTRVLTLVTADNLEELLRKKLEKTGFFGARFRENAGRALLLPRGGFKKRMPLWLNRLRSKKLLDAVLRYDNFPVLVETWRGCLNDEFDLKNLKMLLDELRTGEVSVDEVHTKTPSPFARGLIWQQTQKHMYEGDTPHAPGTSRLSDDLYREVAFSSHLRPGIGRDQIRRFQEKLQRTASGYSPGTALELLEWVKERILIPVSEWEKLIISMEHDLCKDRDNVLKPVSNKLALIKLPGSAFPSVTAVESIPKLLKALNLDHSPADETPRETSDEKADEQAAEKTAVLENIVGEWLFYYGPVEQSYLTEVFGLDTSLMSEILEVLSGNKSVVIDRLTEGAAVPEVCDSQNLEYLLRLIRAGSRPAFKALDARYLPLFLAELHCLTDRGDSISDLQAAFDKLFGYPADARLWETEFFPSRLKHYFSSWLDTLMQQNELMWFGCGRERVSFCFESDYELFMFNENTEIEDRAPGIKELFPDERGRFSFRDILDYSGISTQKLTDLLWEKTWKGEIFNDSWGSVRRGILTRFKGQDVTGNRKSGRRGKINRWKTSRPISGSWYPPGYKPQEPDIIEEEELIKDRVRQLLQRYGILFRELLDRELSFMKWPEVFRTLRIMELSGEVLGGHFFSGITGLQFISHRAFRLLKNGLSEDAVYWMNACDPVSICGVKLEGLPYRLPSRLSSNHLIFHGPNLVLVSRKKGREVQFFGPPENPHIMRYLDFFKTLINRDFMPEPDIKVEKINGLPVDRSPYRGIFISFGFKKGYRGFVLRRAFS